MEPGRGVHRGEWVTVMLIPLVIRAAIPSCFSRRCIPLPLTPATLPLPHNTRHPTHPPTPPQFVGWPGKPLNYFTVKQLGIIYCMNRPSRLYALAMPSKHPHANTRGGGKTETEVAKTGAGAPTNTTTTNTSNATGGTSGSGGSGGTGGAGATTANAVTTEPPACVCLTQGLLSAHSPRFTPDGAVVIFLSHEAAAQTGTHDGTGEGVAAGVVWVRFGMDRVGQVRCGGGVIGQTGTHNGTGERECWWWGW